MKWMLWCVMLVSIGLGAEENFVMLEGSTGAVMKQVGPDLEKRVSPCCSFTIVLSLMGYDAGILVDTETPEWPFQEGYDDFLPVWKEPQTPLSWMQYSCVWYSEVLSRKLGQEKMQGYLDGMQYGNQDILGEKQPVWINS